MSLLLLFTPPSALEMATELEAVNQMLRATGQAPVTAITATSPRQVLLAQAEFLSTVKKIQTIGWHWNTLRTISPAPDGSGQITVPNTYLGVDTDPIGADRCENIIMVGLELFDIRNDTNVFSSTLELEVIVERTLAQIPNSFMEWIIAEATRRFHAATHGDGGRDRELRSDEATARSQARAENMRTSDSNALRHNRTIRRHTYKFPL